MVFLRKTGGTVVVVCLQRASRLSAEEQEGTACCELQVSVTSEENHSLHDNSSWFILFQVFCCNQGKQPSLWVLHSGEWGKICLHGCLVLPFWQHPFRICNHQSGAAGWADCQGGEYWAQCCLWHQWHRILVFLVHRASSSCHVTQAPTCRCIWMQKFEMNRNNANQTTVDVLWCCSLKVSLPAQVSVCFKRERWVFCFSFCHQWENNTSRICCMLGVLHGNCALFGV